MDFKNSETCLNLMRAYAGESQAHMRYSFFESRAKEEGLHEIERIFRETAANERAHAHIYFKLIERNIGSQSVPVNGEYPVHLGDTLSNLKSAASGEHDEGTNVYPTFAKIAKEEGFLDAARHFDLIAQIEKEHEERYNYYANLIATGALFVKDNKVYYKCIHCGYVHEATEAPQVCPNCFHPQGFFKVVPEPWQ